MSFASNARAESARELCVNHCCARAELAAALIGSEGITYRFGSTPGYTLAVTTSEAAGVRHYFQLLKRCFGVSAQIQTIRSDALKGSTRYRLLIPDEEGRNLLDACGLYAPDALFGISQVPNDSVLENDCCRRAYIKSMFIVSGGIADPEREYHAEFSVATEDQADFLIKQLNLYELNAKKACRKTKYVVYLKSGDGVSDVLSIAGASQSVFALHNVRAKKGVSNHVNRQMNCDAANIGRVMETAGTQIADIELIRDTIGLEKLPEALREIALVRLENSATSLTGLGEKLSRPLGKSGVNARLKKLSAIADKLRNGEDTGL